MYAAPALQRDRAEVTIAVDSSLRSVLQAYLYPTSGVLVQTAVQGQAAAWTNPFFALKAGVPAGVIVRSEWLETPRARPADAHPGEMTGTVALTGQQIAQREYRASRQTTIPDVPTGEFYAASTETLRISIHLSDTITLPLALTWDREEQEKAPFDSLSDSLKEVYRAERQRLLGGG
jgi:hypothetical protein